MDRGLYELEGSLRGAGCIECMCGICGCLGVNAESRGSPPDFGMWIVEGLWGRVVGSPLNIIIYYTGI